MVCADDKIFVFVVSGVSAVVFRAREKPRVGETERRGDLRERVNSDKCALYELGQGQSTWACRRCLHSSQRVKVIM